MGRQRVRRRDDQHWQSDITDVATTEGCRVVGGELERLLVSSPLASGNDNDHNTPTWGYWGLSVAGVRVSMTMAACAVWWVESGGARRAQHGTFQPGPPVSQLPAWCRHTAGKVLLANKFVFTLWGVTVRSYSEELYQYQSRTARSQSVSR